MKITSLRAGVAVKRGNPVFKPSPFPAGLTEINGKNKVESVTAPDADGARERVIRYHELLHANFSKHEDLNGSVIDQIVEDGYVHLTYWPADTPKTTNADAVNVALQDLIGLQPYSQSEDPRVRAMVYNQAIQIAARSFAIMAKCEPSNEQKISAIHNINKAFGGKLRLPEILSVFCHAIKDNYRHRAKQLIYDILQKPPPDENDKDKDGKRGQNYYPTREEEDRNPFVDLVPPGKEDGEGEPGYEPMAIHHPPRPEQCVIKGRGTSPASSGQRLMVRRFAHAIANGHPYGLFRHRTPEGGMYQGTIVIDASGSMGMNDKVLQTLCRLSSYLQVAYYSSTKFKPGSHGTLVVYAKGGLRAANIVYRTDDGNSVDLYALRWLLEQRSPLYLVTDEEFCGGPMAQALLAHHLLDTHRDQITTFKSCAEALTYFEKKAQK